MTKHPMQTSKYDNVGLKEHSKIGKFLSDKQNGTMKNAFRGMQNTHVNTFKSFERIDADTTLTPDAKNLLKGNIGVKASEEFKNHAVKLRGEAKGLLTSLNNSLYSNSAQIDQNQMMMVGLVGDQLKEEGLKYLDRSEYVHPIALVMAKAGLLPHKQNEAIIEKLDRHHSSDTLANISATEDVINSIDYAIQNEEKLILANTPAPEELKTLQSSSALDEVRKLTGGV